MAEYIPRPIDTTDVELPADISVLVEKLAENAHDIWAAQRFKDGWTYGPTRDDAEKKHPCLIPYDELPESEKEYDRATSMFSLKAVVALGYQIVKK